MWTRLLKARLVIVNFSTGAYKWLQNVISLFSFLNFKFSFARPQCRINWSLIIVGTLLVSLCLELSNSFIDLSNKNIIILFQMYSLISRSYCYNDHWSMPLMINNCFHEVFELKTHFGATRTLPDHNFEYKRTMLWRDTNSVSRPRT